jgi:radical SAM superfamily enzyme
MVIHRLTGDAPKKLLIAPTWSANKKVVLNTITKYFNDNDIKQGNQFNN